MDLKNLISRIEFAASLARIARNGPEGMEDERGRVEHLHPRLFVHVELAWPRY